MTTLWIVTSDQEVVVSQSANGQTMRAQELLYATEGDARQAAGPVAKRKLQRALERLFKSEGWPQPDVLAEATLAGAWIVLGDRYVAGCIRPIESLDPAFEPREV